MESPAGGAMSLVVIAHAHILEESCVTTLAHIAQGKDKSICVKQSPSTDFAGIYIPCQFLFSVGMDSNNITHENCNHFR